MVKKIITIAVIGIMLFGVFGLTACTDDEENKNMGTFYSLQEAYDLRLLTKQDLQSIAYYYHGLLDDADSAFIPTPKIPEELSVETTNTIRQSFFKIYIEPYNDKKNQYSTIVEIEKVEILSYCGTYNNAIAIMMKDNYVRPAEVRNVVVGDIVFTYSSGNDILIWIEN